MKKTTLACLASIVTVIIWLSLFNCTFAQPSQVSYTVNLNSFKLQLTYPAQVLPGGSVSVSVQASPKSDGVCLQSLTATIYYADSSGLHSLATETLVSSPAYSYGSYVTSAFSKSFTVSVPQDAPRTSLVAVFSESVQSTYYFAYPCVVDMFVAECTYQYGWYSYSSYSVTSDDAIAPLSYIQATTPEYLALQSKYQALQQQLNQTRAELNQNQARLEQSQTQNQQLQSTVSQQGDKINQLNQRLANANAMTQTYQFTTLALGIIAVLLLVFTVYLWRTRRELRKPAETAASTQPA
jgi:hypothetical protein